MVKKIVSIAILLGVLSLLVYSQEERKSIIFPRSGTIGIIYENGMLFVPETGLLTPVIYTRGLITFAETGEVIPVMEMISPPKDIQKTWTPSYVNSKIENNSSYYKIRKKEELAYQRFKRNYIRSLRSGNDDFDNAPWRFKQRFAEEYILFCVRYYSWMRFIVQFTR